MKILNLYAGIGGNRKLWDGDIQVTAVEIDPDIAAVYQNFFPEDTVIVGDAHDYLLNHYSEFDFIWSSPPCQTHSKLNMVLKTQGTIRFPDMKLYQEIIFLKHFFDGKWVVENVVSYYKPLIEPARFCRHYFWSNFLIKHKEIKYKTSGNIGGKTWFGVKKLQGILGFSIDEFKIEKMTKKQVLNNCMNPELGKHIFDCAMGSIINEKQLELFG